MKFFLHITDASVVISPPRDYITFENNASNFTFNCNGSGKYLLWTVDGYGTGSPSVRSKGIEIASYIQDGHSVSSQLSIPKTRANSNITVICTVMKYLRIPSSAESSEPVKLILQGMFVVVCILCVLYACRYMTEPITETLLRLGTHMV